MDLLDVIVYRFEVHTRFEDRFTYAFFYFGFLFAFYFLFKNLILFYYWMILNLKS